MGCFHSRVGPTPSQSTIRETRWSKFKKRLFLPKRELIPDKTTIFVAIDHSGKLSEKLEEKKKGTGWRKSDMKSVMADATSLKRTPFGFTRRDVVPPIEKEEEVEITVVYTAQESRIIIDPSHVIRDDGFRVVEKKFTVPKSDKVSRNIIEGLRLYKRKNKPQKPVQPEAIKDTQEQKEGQSVEVPKVKTAESTEPTESQDTQEQKEEADARRRRSER